MCASRRVGSTLSDLYWVSEANLLASFRDLFKQVQSSEQSRLINQFGLTAGADFACLGIGVLTGALTARILGPTGRGELAAIQLWAPLIATLGTLGLNNALVFFISKRVDKSDRELSSLIWAYFLVSIPISAVSLCLGYLLLPYLLRAQSESIIQQARFYLLWVPTAIISAANFALQGTGEFGAWNLYRLQRQVVYFLILLALWITGNVSASNIAYTSIALGFINVIVVIFMLRKKVGLVLSSPDMEILPDMISYGMKSLLGRMPELANVKLDQVVIGAFLPAADLGLYAVAVTWSMGMRPLMRGIGEVIFPWIARASDSIRAEDRFTKSTRVSILVGVLASLVFLLPTPLALPLIVGADFASVVPSAMILIVGAAVWQINFVIQRGLSGLDLPGATAWSQGIGLVVSGGLLYWLVPVHGVRGAAAASLLAYFASFLTLLFFVRGRTSIGIRDMIWPRIEDWYTIARILRRKLTRS